VAGIIMDKLSVSSIESCFIYMSEWF